MARNEYHCLKSRHSMKFNIFFVSADQLFSMKCIFKYLFLMILGLSLAGCSPFENSSLIEIVTQPISHFLNSKTSAEIVSGGTKTIETNPSTPSLNYKAAVSVGGTYNQTATTTNGGYKIYTTIQGSDVQ
jgi:hypothetical protein